MGFLQPHADRIYAALRIMAGLLFFEHGLQKLFGLFGGSPEGIPAFITYGAGGIELICGLLIAIGLFTAPAAFLASGTMAAAFFMGHVAQQGTIIPIVNKGELAVLYCFAFLYLSVRGSGIWSVDQARGAQTT